MALTVRIPDLTIRIPDLTIRIPDLTITIPDLTIRIPDLGFQVERASVLNPRAPLAERKHGVRAQRVDALSQGCTMARRDTL